MIRIRILFGLFSAALVFLSCEDDATPPSPPPPYVPTIQLSMEDASCTEAWLKVKLTDNAEPRTVALKRDSQAISTARLTTSDSVLIDENLLPRRTYTYKAFRLSGTTATDSTAPLQVTTMDTTSHNFTWQLDTLGDAYSILSDVAVINDTLAYVVGEMYLRDSTGQVDPHAYNMAKWNGHRWELMRIQFYTFCGQPYTGSYPAKAVFAFGPQDVWIGMYGSQVVHWNGQSQSVPTCIPVSINKLWGTSGNDLYAVGYGGGIAHYDGSTWQRLTSGTTLGFRDIFGARNHSGQMEILALASTYTVQTQEVRIFQLSGSTATPVSVTGLASDMSGIWFVPGKKYYAVGAGIHRKRSLSDSAWVPYPYGLVTRFGSWGVRGTGVNNVFVAGSFGELVHFNGVSWHRYFGSVPIPGGALGPLAVTDRLIMAVGDLDANRGLVLIGRR